MLTKYLLSSFAMEASNSSPTTSFSVTGFHRYELEVYLSRLTISVPSKYPSGFLCSRQSSCEKNFSLRCVVWLFACAYWAKSSCKLELRAFFNTLSLVFIECRISFVIQTGWLGFLTHLDLRGRRRSRTSLRIVSIELRTSFIYRTQTLRPVGYIASSLSHDVRWYCETDPWWVKLLISDK